MEKQYRVCVMVPTVRTVIAYTQHEAKERATRVPPAEAQAAEHVLWIEQEQPPECHQLPGGAS